VKAFKGFLLVTFIAIFAFEAYMVLAFVLGFHRSEEYLPLLPKNIIWLLFCLLITLFFLINKIKSSYSHRDQKNTASK